METKRKLTEPGNKTMPKPTNTNPLGFNPVPTNLEALSFLQHIKKFTTSK
jgi:hypothetical protein